MNLRIRQLLLNTPNNWCGKHNVANRTEADDEYFQLFVFRRPRENGWVTEIRVTSDIYQPPRHKPVR